LFHRLEVFVVQVPPLRERRGDIGAIARAILGQLAGELGPHDLAPAAVARLVAHEWPGNVRELRNVLYRAADLTRSARTIDAGHVERALHLRDEPQKRTALTPPLARALMREHADNLSAAARAAGYPRTTFRKLLLSSG
jgi:DNA-binding NtrC family response regulator